MISVYWPNQIDIYEDGVTISDDNSRGSPTGFESIRDRSNDTGLAASISQGGHEIRFNVAMSGAPDLDTICLLRHTFNNFTITATYNISQTWTQNFRPSGITSSGTRIDTIIKIPGGLTSVSNIHIDVSQLGSVVGPFLSQLIFTRRVGVFENQLAVRKVEFGANKNIHEMINKKSRVVFNERRFRLDLYKENVVSRNDLQLQETIFSSRLPLLYVVSENESVFSRTGVLGGYGIRDMTPMVPTNTYAPNYHNSRWNQGAFVDIKLVESA